MGPFKVIRNISAYVMGQGAVAMVPGLLEPRRRSAASSNPVVFLVDEFFAGRDDALAALAMQPQDAVRFVKTAEEPTTSGVDRLMQELRSDGYLDPCAIVGMGGGCTLDTAKAVANLYTNPGPSAQYQGWDLVRHPGVFKIGVPTISGTGAESSRTCVLTNHASGLKLGMNSDYTLYDQLVLDPDLTATVDRNQYFYTGMDSYIHCIESLAGSYRSPVADALSAEALDLCETVFTDGDMLAPVNREKLMTASYLGGCAIASSFVGVVHPVSAGLSVVLGVHHCVANCITMLAMDDFYPEAVRTFREMQAHQGVSIPSGVCADLSDDDINEMCKSALLHEKPLTNALGENFRQILTPERLARIYRRM
jgi:3-deoxy-alpha-D-manno-octulosonate 8-oxidase